MKRHCNFCQQEFDTLQETLDHIGLGKDSTKTCKIDTLVSTGTLRDPTDPAFYSS